jgi:hypothetical protein
MNTEIKFYKIDNYDIEKFILNRENGMPQLLISGIEKNGSALIISKVDIERIKKERPYLRTNLVGIEIQAGVDRGYYTGYVGEVINIKKVNGIEANIYKFNVIEKHETCAWSRGLLPNYNNKSLTVSFQ